MEPPRPGRLNRLLAVSLYQGRAGWLRGGTIALAAALFLAFAGAFGTDEAPLPVRLAYWVSLMLLGTVWGAFVVGVLFPGEQRARRPWVSAVGAATVMAVPYTGVVAIVTRWLFTGAPALSYLFAAVFGVCLAMTILNVLVEGRRTPAPVEGPASPGSGRAPVRFLERLPPKLRGGTLWAVESEDHYLRLHTSRGQDLILMRLADAVAELEGLEGAQVHRSWWVSRQAIADARRGDGRATLVLPDGAVVPVSRTYAPELRRKNWI